MAGDKRHCRWPRDSIYMYGENTFLPHSYSLLSSTKEHKNNNSNHRAWQRRNGWKSRRRWRNWRRKTKKKPCVVYWKITVFYWIHFSKRRTPCAMTCVRACVDVSGDRVCGHSRCSPEVEDEKKRINCIPFPCPNGCRTRPRRVCSPKKEEKKNENRILSDGRLFRGPFTGVNTRASAFLCESQ